MSQDTLVHDDDGAVASNLPPDPSRRFWVAAACTVGGIASVATAIPFVGTFSPSIKARAAGAPVAVDVGDIPIGAMKTVKWRGKPVWILHRSAEQIAGLHTQNALLADPDSKRPGFTPKYAENVGRSRNPALFVCVGICTHLGCSPAPRFETGDAIGMGSSWQGGFLCPCHGSTFDLAGRVYKNKPAPDNLEIPPYQYLTGSRIIVGVDEDNKA